MPAQAGIQVSVKLKRLDSRFRGNDGKENSGAI
jgi:hypothetical protein